ncbi:hypothetical protein B0H10DRAFT_2241694 [Mycena sp. CBHHK59/15]|nr:hypothetical protein B0H10DRAFT_2241694 [Mycena sp. CBHHK59/15]
MTSGLRTASIFSSSLPTLPFTTRFGMEAAARLCLLGPNRLDIFGIGTDSSLYHKWWDGKSWGPSLLDWENLGGKWMEKPSVVAWGLNRLDVFVVGEGRGLYQKFWDGETWNNGFVNLGGQHRSSPSVVSWGPDRIDIFTAGMDSVTYHKWWDGKEWGPSGPTGPYESMGGILVGCPKAVCWGPNRIDLFIIGLNSALYHKWWDGTQWVPRRLDVFVIGLDSAVYHKWWDGESWGPSVTGYERMGGVVIRDITAVCWGPNRIDMFVIGTDGATYHKAWSLPSGWYPSLTDYEKLGGISYTSVAQAS